MIYFSKSVQSNEQPMCKYTDCFRCTQVVQIHKTLFTQHPVPGKMAAAATLSEFLRDLRENQSTQSQFSIAELPWDTWGTD